MAWDYRVKDLKGIVQGTLLAIKVWKVDRFVGPQIYRVVKNTPKHLLLVDDLHGKHILTYDLHLDNLPAMVQVVSPLEEHDRS